ncbi:MULTISPECIES: hypothetical protein [unclassified Rhizobium]|uniref:hypothetical protein n=1 Tax=unclassified Rhizobium TaxID=2613769 RepID=UPI00160F2193|nr:MULTISPECIES: hypothetical protein [unclassified Rhizobium]MBB3319357.1 hypothetical protein [Rhizobium sp. BK181]MBB3542900.1 hypothetical protein [Rhizobium sp. BK399]MCS3742801.1 hypothetical protein [Rhizobium sp. BK661]MCS4095027.1 hypothetical protein [Rhizobium sp. BK176]
MVAAANPADSRRAAEGKSMQLKICSWLSGPLDEQMPMNLLPNNAGYMVTLHLLV